MKINTANINLNPGLPKPLIIITTLRLLLLLLLLLRHHTCEYLNVYKNYKQQLALFGKGKGQF